MKKVYVHSARKFEIQVENFFLIVLTILIYFFIVYMFSFFNTNLINSVAH